MRCERVLTIVAAAALFATPAYAQTPATGGGIKITKDQPTTTTTPSTSMAPDTGRGMGRRGFPAFDIAAYNNLTEANMIAHLAAGDSVEVKIAQLAQTKATDQRVKDFATMLVTDHSAHLGKVLHVMTDKNIGSQPLANDPEGARSMAQLNRLTSMPAGAQWDAMFLRGQISHHQNELSILNAMHAVVKTEDLSDVLDQTIQAVTKHRDAGQSVATTLGVTVRSSGTTNP